MLFNDDWNTWESCRSNVNHLDWNRPVHSIRKELLTARNSTPRMHSLDFLFQLE
jgi:hypothetical protein